MNTCHVLDLLLTPFIDGECTAEERAMVTAHLRECAECRQRLEAESTARHVLHTHAAIARTIGAPPAWRPRVWWLGHPWLGQRLRVHPRALLLAAVLSAGLLVLWIRPAQASAIGVIGDSVCQRKHLFTERFNVDDRACTLGCVKRGAAFVLITDTRVYRIRNQELPELATFASMRVRVTGSVNGEEISITSIAAVGR
jgi:anti-sigma factor RsiW